MIKDIIHNNEGMTPIDHELDILRTTFPACFHTDGSFDFTRFKEYLNDKMNVVNEGYGLHFLGKNYARLLASLETTTVVVPDEEHNDLPENRDSHNIYISGDNLDALKHLLHSYEGSIKCIYIDPPYNTGTDGFVYNDNFKFTPENLSERLSIGEDEAARILDMTRRGAASHSAWLTFMLPRLELARDLLSDDGVIFISIDDNEQANLKLLCDEVFGEENFMAQIIVQSNKRGQTYKQLSKTHEYLLVYVRSEKTVINELIKDIDGIIRKDDIGEFTERELRNRNPKYGRFNRPNLFYPIYVNPTKIDANGYSPVSDKKFDGWIEVLPYNSIEEESCWRWGRKKLNDNNSDSSMSSNVVARKKSNGNYGIYEKYRKKTYKAKTIWFDGLEMLDADDDELLIWDETQVITEQGTTELRKYGMGDVFDFPKPSYLIKKVLALGSNTDSICLDFFSGSATSADAVFQLNAEKGERKFILVQLPEDMDLKLSYSAKSDKQKIQNIIDFLDNNNHPHTLDFIGIERIKRAAKKIKKENPLFHGDLGFKHYTLKEPESKLIDQIEDFDTTTNDTFLIDTLLNEFGTATVLATWLVRDGYGLTDKAEELDLAGYKAYYKDRHLYLLHSGLSDAAVDALVTKYETDKDFNPLNVVIFGYSFNWTEMETLKVNLKRLQATEKNLRLNFDVRY